MQDGSEALNKKRKIVSKKRQTEVAPESVDEDVIDIDASQGEASPLEQMIEDAITYLRNEIAHKQREEHGDTGNAGTVNATHIWTSGLTADIARRKPKSIAELQSIPRCSRVMLKKYGDQILQTVQGVIDEYNVIQAAEMIGA